MYARFAGDMKYGAEHSRHFNVRKVRLSKKNKASRSPSASVRMQLSLSTKPPHPRTHHHPFHALQPFIATPYPQHLESLWDSLRAEFISQEGLGCGLEESRLHIQLFGRAAVVHLYVRFMGLQYDGT
jgi:hypothetical protein